MPIDPTPPPATPGGDSAERGPRTVSYTKDPEGARRLAIAAAVSLDEDKCTNVVVLDLRGRSQVADYFVVATGTSDRQMRSAALRVAEAGEAMGMPPFRSTLDERGGADGRVWFVLDFVDVVVHVFDEESRMYYDLESLWGDGPIVDWAEGRPSAGRPRGLGLRFPDSN